MPPDSIQFVLPTTRSFDGMKRVLFQPFDIGKWFVLGFTAWLAGLLDGGGSANANVGSDQSGGGGLESFCRENIELVIIIAIVVLVIAVAVFVVFLWLSSRGKFMFLDNVVHNRAEVKAPWHRFRTEGNSLFVWRLIFTLIFCTVLALPVGGAVGLFFVTRTDTVMMIPPLILCGGVLLVVILVATYIGILLEDFVIPLMYRDSLTTNEAWRRFLALHGTATGQFVLYALWKLLLGLAAGICILAVGFGTCCIGFVLMVIPYLGTVLLLPMIVLFRFLGPEFLRQFGSDYDILAPAADTPQLID